MLGLLSYLPTFATMPHMLYMLAILYAIALRISSMVYNASPLQERKMVIDINFTIILFIVVLSFINNAIHYNKLMQLKDFFPFYVLIPFSFLIAYTMTRSDLKVIVLLSFLEGISVLIEYSLGITTFFPSLKLYAEFQESDLFYFTRPLGLSENSSIAASKFVVAVLLIDYLKMKERYWDLVKLVLLAAIFLTFNRTSLLVMIVYYIFSFGKNVIVYKSPKIRYFFMTSITLIFIMASLVAIWEYSYEIIIQLTRNTKRVELTGREVLWANYMEFIRQNILFGNGSYKLYMGDSHAHNSYIQSLATNGIVISILYYYLVLRNLDRRNILPAGILLLFSFFQYGIYWGISLMDIALFIFLFRDSGSIRKNRFYSAKELRIELPEDHSNYRNQ